MTLPLFVRPLETLSHSDVQQLVAERHPETDTLEFEIQGIGVAPELATWSEGGFPTSATSIEPQPLVLPRIGVRGTDDFPLILRLVFRDILNAAGLDLGDTALTVNPSVFAP
jgi:hypothetical protein